MEKKVDRRVIKTRRQLKKGLAALMKEKSVNQITVKELVEEVDINRSTFYLHFKDIQDHSLNLCSYLCPLFLLLRIPDVFILKFILNQILRIGKVFREQNPKTVIFLQKRVEFLLQKRYNN